MIIDVTDRDSGLGAVALCAIIADDDRVRDSLPSWTVTVELHEGERVEGELVHCDDWWQCTDPALTLANQDAPFDGPLIIPLTEIKAVKF